MEQQGEVSALMKGLLKAGWGYSAGGLGEGDDVGILSGGNQEDSIEMLTNNMCEG